MDKEQKKLLFTRRQFLKTSLITGAAIGIGGAGVLIKPGVANAATSSPNLGKWMQPLRNLDILSPGAAIQSLRSHRPHWGLGELASPTRYFRTQPISRLLPDRIPIHSIRTFPQQDFGDIGTQESRLQSI